MDLGSLGRWVELSLGRPCVLGNAELISRGPEREVWDIDVEDHSLVLTLFLPGDRSSVNTSLPPAEVARKCHLAMTDLRKSGLLTPNVVGSAVEASAAALATRRETVTPWSRGMRGEAAELLALLHAVPPGSLSAELGALVRSSDARHDRVRVGLSQMTAQLDRATPRMAGKTSGCSRSCGPLARKARLRAAPHSCARRLLFGEPTGDSERFGHRRLGDSGSW